MSPHTDPAHWWVAIYRLALVGLTLLGLYMQTVGMIERGEIRDDIVEVKGVIVNGTPTP